jgi:transposase
MTLEPLADYLEPQFGNIYEYNLPGSGSFEVQEWTDELRPAVKQYLVREVSDDDYAAFLDELAFDVPAGARTDQADHIIERAEAWEIAHAFHLAAVKAVPTLDELIGQHDAWSDASLQVDAGEWLDAHTSPEQLHALAEITGHPERNVDTPWYRPEPIGQDFTSVLAPPDLLAAWHQVVGPAESDLTDDEWKLLVPRLPALKYRHGVRARSESELLSLRHAFDGIRYKFTYDLPWSRVPQRYGAGHNLYSHYVRYREDGHFARMLETLEGRPGSERMAAWLKVVASR